MPWTAERYPVAMRNLPPLVRLKAIAIANANALLAEGMDDGRAIRIAIARARQWAIHEFGGRVVRFRPGADCLVGTMPRCLPGLPPVSSARLSVFFLKKIQARSA